MSWQVLGQLSMNGLFNNLFYFYYNGISSKFYTTKETIVINLLWSLNVIAPIIKVLPTWQDWINVCSHFCQ
jgi:hypothetical protein